MKYRIREARAAKGWTQAELAERAGVTQQAIQRYEVGTREPRASALVGIAKACGVSISYLLGIAEEGGTAPETLTYDEQRREGACAMPYRSPLEMCRSCVRIYFA